MFSAKNKNRTTFYLVKLMVVLSTLALISPAAWGAAPKNVIVMVPDGCAASIQTLTRLYKGEDLNIDGLAAGQVRTNMANSVITGSAAAATAFATGQKTTARFLGIGPRPDDNVYGDASLAYKPLLTLLEAAKKEGYCVGLISTSRITHATPAAYASHVLDRGFDNQIMEQMVYNDIDVVFGGGKRHLLPTTMGGKRTDGENLLQELINRGYAFAHDKAEMMALTDAPAWGLFSSSHMAAHIDNSYFGKGQPTLAEMTGKAIDLLSKKAESLGVPFLLMVEGSQVDWAGHANDPFHMVTDMLAFDDAVAVAKDWVDNELSLDTVIHIFPDHNTGALSLGNRSSNSGSAYTSMTLEDMIGPLQDMEITAYSLAGIIGDDLGNKNIMNNIKMYWGIDADNHDAVEIRHLVKKEGLYLDYAIGEVISKNHTYFGWTSHGHTGEDVPFWSYLKSSDPAETRPFGHFDNTALAGLAADALGVTLNGAAAYVDALDHFGTNASIDKTDPENPVLVVNDSGNEYRFSADKDLVYKNGSLLPEMAGIAVYSPAKEWCVSADGSVSSAKSIGSCSGDKFVKSNETMYLPASIFPLP